MATSAIRWLCCLLLAAAGPLYASPLHAPPLDAAPAARACTAPGRALARPPVSGALGPLAAVTVAVTRDGGTDAGAFDVRLRLPDGRCMTVAGTEDPNQLFLYAVTAIRFAPLRGTRGNALVVFYNESQIGPGNGTDRYALVYRLSAAQRGQVRVDRRVLDGVATLAQVQRKLGRAR